MKAPVLLALTLSAAPFAVAVVDTGATLDEVKAALGTPNGQMRFGERQMLYYARGSVEMINGRVTRVALLSAEEHQAQLAREERLVAERETRRAQLIGEGTALRDRKLADEAFRSAPVAYQVSFWEDFARRYPGVPCAEPLTIARLKLGEQLEEKNRKAEELRRLAEIEERLAAAEREPTYRHTAYPFRGRRDRHQEFGFGQISYRFYDAPLPVYTTPTEPLIRPLTHDPAHPGRPNLDRSDRERWERDRRDGSRGHTGWRGNERSRHHRRDRM